MKTLEEVFETWEAVIGLEIHAELTTLETKMFCGCKLEFGAAPNTHTCPVCLGLPGALPVPNRAAIESIVLAGLATNCDIEKHSMFYRKNYMYPDMAKNFQTTQGPIAFCMRGHLALDVDGRGATERYRLHALAPGETEGNITRTEDGYVAHVGITRIHMENDAGKNIHAQGENVSYVDLNRAGTPLVEIVSEPDMRSSAEAVAYLKALYGIVTYLGVCDGNMEEGSFRCDANVSIRPVGSTTFGTRTELKNLNSFRNVQRAIDYEIARQQDALADGEEIVQETRLYDATKNITASMRGKEEAHDYRYFPDPDLLPVTITDEEFSRWQQELPELPAARMQRFIAMTGLPEPEAEVLVQSRAMADFFEAAAAKADARKVANFILGPLLRELNARSLHVQDLDWVVISVGEGVEQSLSITLNVQELGGPKIWVKASNEEHKKILQRLHVDRAIVPEMEAAVMAAHQLCHPGMLDLIPKYGGIAIQELRVDNWHGRTLVDLNLFQSFGVMVMGILTSMRNW